MPLTPFPVEQFGGLDLFRDPTEIGMAAAVGLLNVVLDPPGRVQTRFGYTKLSTSATPAAINYLIPLTDTIASPRLMALGVSDVSAIDLATGVRTAQNGGSGYGSTVTNITRPALWSIDSLGPIVFWASDTGAAAFNLKYADAAGTLSFTSGFPQYVCGVPSRGAGGLAPRLAQAGYFTAVASPSGAHGSFSTVFFSDPLNNAPPSWTSTNWVQLDPGDGEKFTGMVAYNGSLWLFKSTHAYEFYGESVDSTGNPVFNYRRIDLPDPIPRMSSPTAWQPVAVGPGGIYYVGTQGLCRVNSSGAVRLSTPIDPILAGTADPTLAVGTVGQVRMEWAGAVLHISYALGSAAQRLLRWDTSTDTWTLHSYAKTLTTLPLFVPTFGSNLFFGASDGNAYKIAPAATDDNGTAIAWNYQTGYSNAGGYFRARIISSGERKRHFKTDIEGSGTVTHQVLALNGRPGDLADPGGAVTLGTAPVIARGSRRRGVRGTYFAHKLSGTGPTTVSGMTYWLANVESDT